MGGSARFIRYAAIIAVLALWAAGAARLLKAEWGATRLLPGLLYMRGEERAALVGGPLYGLSMRAASIVPEDKTIVFVSPRKEPVVGPYSGKSKYYLYPRRVIVVNAGEPVDAGVVRGADYLMVYSPPESYDPGVEPALGAMVGLKRLYWNYGDGGYEAIYSVVKEGL